MSGSVGAGALPTRSSGSLAALLLAAAIAAIGGSAAVAARTLPDRAEAALLSLAETKMEHSYSRRYPRLLLPALPRLDLGSLWQHHRAVLLRALGPVLGLLLLLGGALLAVDQYSDAKAEVRRAETGRYLAEFRAGPVDHAWHRLNAAWQAEWGRQRALLDKVATASGPRFDLAVRNYRDFVLDTIDQDRLAEDIETVRAFFARFGACIRVGSCDPTAAAAQLGPSVWQFRNQHYYYFRREGLIPEVDRSAFLIAPPVRREPAA